MNIQYYCSKCFKEKVRYNNRLLCKPCIADAQRIYRLNNNQSLKDKKILYRKNNPDKWRNRNLVNNYGITLEQYKTLFVSQNNVCKICKHPERSKRYVYLCVDHCHKTGRIRGLLCNRCNRAIGLLDDDYKRIKGILNYLIPHDVPQAA